MISFVVMTAIVIFESYSNRIPNALRRRQYFCFRGSRRHRRARPADETRPNVERNSPHGCDFARENPRFVVYTWAHRQYDRHDFSWLSNHLGGDIEDLGLRLSMIVIKDGIRAGRVRVSMYD